LAQAGGKFVERARAALERIVEEFKKRAET